MCNKLTFGAMETILMRKTHEFETLSRIIYSRYISIVYKRIADSHGLYPADNNYSYSYQMKSPEKIVCLVQIIL